ncbi:MAG TPA: nicotinate (nicotinamide) nucleotide adenylyltransferase [Eubacteriales bacterium]|nr:nicotinate (nicotinamide) nucleotide adenylyltransferase [Eubacteriales bacterium]
MKVGVFGGAFDPPHSEHIKAAAAAARAVPLDLVIIVPTYFAPHKAGASEAYQARRDMAEAAFSDFPVKVIVSDIEKDAGGASFTVRTLQELKKCYDELYLIIGGDSLERFDHWYKPDEILRLSRLVVFPRTGYTGAETAKARLTQKYGGEIIILDGEGADLSSSVIRAMLYLGLKADLPQGVAEIIKEQGLYRRYTSLLEGIDKLLTGEKLTHSKWTAVEAVKILTKFGFDLSFERVFTAAILHDAGKYSRKYREAVPPESIGTPVEHQFEGAIIAEHEFNVSDRGILDAIRYHSTGRPNMSLLEKIVFVADKIEATCDYHGVEELRSAIYHDFETGFAEVLKRSYLLLKSKKREIFPLTVEAYKYYKGEV